MIVFAIESSCDETSVAIIKNNSEILSHITFSQRMHKKFGGVVPELASRAHLQILQSIVPKALKEAKISLNEIDLFCSTCGPGLIGGLIVGSTFTKALAISSKKPFFPINHLEGHLLSPSFNNINIFPCLSFLLTGGHTQIYFVKSVNDYELIGETKDDAIGESFDKVAKLMKLNYPGGPEIEKWAKNGNKNFFKLPHPLSKGQDLNFSFSGIKTAVSLIVKKKEKIDNIFKKNMSASFQQTIMNILQNKLELSLKFLSKHNKKIKTISLVGGVASNNAIQSCFLEIAKKHNCRLVYPPKNMFSDNAAMIAWACIKKFKKNKKNNLNFIPNPRLSIDNTK